MPRCRLRVPEPGWWSRVKGQLQKKKEKKERSKVPETEYKMLPNDLNIVIKWMRNNLCFCSLGPPHLPYHLKYYLMAHMCVWERHTSSIINVSLFCLASLAANTVPGIIPRTQGTDTGKATCSNKKIRGYLINENPTVNVGRHILG